jgi:hypothetical protein
MVAKSSQPGVAGPDHDSLTTLAKDSLSPASAIDT